MGIVVAAVRGGVYGGVAGGAMGAVAGCYTGYGSAREVVYCATGGTIGGSAGGAWVGILDELSIMDEMHMTHSPCSENRCD